MSSISGTTNSLRAAGSLHSRLAVLPKLVVDIPTDLCLGKSPPLANLVSLLAAAALQLRQEVGVLILALRHSTPFPSDLDLGSAALGRSE
jgi:hypothetical protein